ncbi:hypothetical protein DFH06DRAFT_644539 [Mycena polygramma]|nr:hypothetical protein DFH06DRAFT_644539 [Mycena polygramma]
MSSFWMIHPNSSSRPVILSSSLVDYTLIGINQLAWAGPVFSSNHLFSSPPSSIEFPKKKNPLTKNIQVEGMRTATVSVHAPRIHTLRKALRECGGRRGEWADSPCHLQLRPAILERRLVALAAYPHLLAPTPLLTYHTNPLAPNLCALDADVMRMLPGMWDLQTMPPPIIASRPKDALIIANPRLAHPRSAQRRRLPAFMRLAELLCVLASAARAYPCQHRRNHRPQLGKVQGLAERRAAPSTFNVREGGKLKRGGTQRAMMDLACPRRTLSTRSSLPSRVRGVLMNAMLAPSLFALPSALRLRVVRRPRPRYRELRNTNPRIAAHPLLLLPHPQTTVPSHPRRTCARSTRIEWGCCLGWDLHWVLLPLKYLPPDILVSTLAVRQCAVCQP